MRGVSCLLVVTIVVSFALAIPAPSTTVVAPLTDSCRNCSGHGDCIRASCVCDKKWEGKYCEKGTAAFKFTASLHSGLTCKRMSPAVCVKACGGHGLCLEGFCKCNLGWTGQDCLTGENRKSHLTFQFNSTVLLDTCPDHCNDRGFCEAGECKCANGWAGASCLMGSFTYNRSHDLLFNIFRLSHLRSNSRSSKPGLSGSHWEAKSSDPQHPHHCC